MISVTNDYKTNISKDARTLKSYVVIDSQTYYDDTIVSITSEDSVNPQDVFAVGTATSTYVEITLLNVTGDFNGKQVTPYIGVDTTGLGNFEYVPLGVFYVEDTGKDKNTVTLKCFDKMILLEAEYSTSLTYPNTLTNIMNEICTKTSISFSGTLPTYSVPKPDAHSFRDVVALIAGVSGGFAKFDRTGVLNIRNYSFTPVRTIDTTNWFELSKDTGSYTIGKVTMKDDSLGVSYTRGTVTNTTMELIVDSQWASDSIVNDIYTKLNGLSFIPIEMSWQGDPSLDVGDWIAVNDIDSTTFNTVLTDIKLDYTGGLSSDASSQCEGKTKNQYNVTPSVPGIKGPPGVNGANGVTYYTWMKYADTPTTGMSDIPDGKKYIGLANNKTTNIESTIYSDYSWSLIQGETGSRGPEADESTLIGTNSNFYNWSGVLPDVYTGQIGVAPTKVASDNKTTGNAVRWDVAAGANTYMQKTVTNVAYSQFLMFEITFKLESGTIDGAGVLVRVEATANVDTYIKFIDYVPSPVLGKWYTISDIIKLPSTTIPSGFTGYSIFPVGGWSTFGTVTSKTIQFDAVKVGIASGTLNGVTINGANYNLINQGNFTAKDPTLGTTFSIKAGLVDRMITHRSGFIGWQDGDMDDYKGFVGSSSLGVVSLKGMLLQADGSLKEDILLPLEVGGLTSDGQVLVKNGGLLVDNSYFEVGSYNDTTYGTGKMQSFFDGVNKLWKIQGKDTLNNLINVDMLLNNLLMHYEGNTMFASGSVNITPTAANTPTKVTVAFGKTFPATPMVVACAYSTLPGTVVTGVSSGAASTTGTDIYVTRTNTTATTIRWVAVWTNI